MINWKEGDRAKIVTRPVTEEDRKTNRYFDHMAGLPGTVQNVYGDDQIAVRIDFDALNPVTAKLQKTSITRMRDKFVKGVSDEQRKQLTKEELEFDANFMLLVRSVDLEKA